MGLIAGIAFDYPYALAALLALPVIWWLLRFTPPAPERIRFPPLRLLLGLKDREETPHKSPWWLTALRILAASLLIVALAQPVLNPNRGLGEAKGALILIVDDGWAAASRWPDRLRTLRTLVRAAEFSARPAVLLTTTPHGQAPTPAPANARLVAGRIAALAPRPFRPDRMALAAILKAQFATATPPGIVWLSDGLDYGRAAEFAGVLAGLGGGRAEVTILSDAAGAGALALSPPKVTDGGLGLTVLRAGALGPRAGKVRAIALDGRALGTGSFAFKAGETSAGTTFSLPLALRNQLARLEIVDERSPAATYLLDDRWRRKPVGLFGGETGENAQPLLSPLYYVERALRPYAELRRAVRKDADSGVKQLLDDGLSMLVLADVGRLQRQDERRVDRWVRAGGVLLRFAGPRLANANDRLIPVKLRRGDRALGGALSWSKPQTLGEFPTKSPFFGLAPGKPGEVTVNRQVLAEPVPGLEARTWARLGDGTPLVSAQSRGRGLVVLFHVPANPGWSNLPVSGLFVEMLRRIVDLSVGVATTTVAAEQAPVARLAVLAPLRLLDGFGQLADPPSTAQPLVLADFATTRPSPDHPAGLYGSDARLRALNIVSAKFRMTPLSPAIPADLEQGGYISKEAVALKPWLLLAAFVLLLIDGVAVLALGGALRLARAGQATASIALVLAATMSPPAARAQEQPGAKPLSPEMQRALKATRETHLAYVRTGDRNVDAISEAGLRGLSDVLRERTALDPGSPMSVDIERDELTFFPFIYWPVIAVARAPSQAAVAKLNAYLKNGGTILFDTRDNQQSFGATVSDDLITPQTRALRRILGQLDIPPLEVVPAEHVLTKAFYLLQSFPGRWSGGQLWVEARTGARDGTDDASRLRDADGVSAIIIGSNDYASAWAVDATRRTMFPVVPGGPRQREFAYRTGVNMVMYALTGNYKADQVHIPALLERLGQ